MINYSIQALIMFAPFLIKLYNQRGGVWLSQGGCLYNKGGVCVSQIYIYGLHDSLLLFFIVLPIITLELEREIFNNKSANYRGAVRISLANLNLEFPDRKRIFHEKNVNRLVRNFKLKGYFRFEPEYYIFRLIDDEILIAILRESGFK